MQHFAQSVVQPLGHHEFSLPRLEGSLGIGLVSIVPDVVRDESLNVADAAFGYSLFLNFT